MTMHGTWSLGYVLYCDYAQDGERCTNMRVYPPMTLQGFDSPMNLEGFDAKALPTALPELNPGAPRDFCPEHGPAGSAAKATTPGPGGGPAPAP